MLPRASGNVGWLVDGAQSARRVAAHVHDAPALRCTERRLRPEGLHRGPWPCNKLSQLLLIVLELGPDHRLDSADGAGGHAALREAAEPRRRAPAPDARWELEQLIFVGEWLESIALLFGERTWGQPWLDGLVVLDVLRAEVLTRVKVRPRCRGAWLVILRVPRPPQLNAFGRPLGRSFQTIPSCPLAAFPRVRGKAIRVACPGIGLETRVLEPRFRFLVDSELLGRATR